MAIAPTNGTAPVGESLMQQGPAQTDMGKDEFLKLLIAQMSNQDPLNPLDDKEFIAQLAQFSGLEQMMELNQRVSLLQASQTAMASADVISLVGHQVVASGDQISLDATDSSKQVHVNMEGDADSVTLEIRDEDGALVRTIEAGSMASGDNTITWDGLDKDGNRAAEGDYTVTVIATDSEGQNVPATTQITGEVSAVVFDNGYAELMVNGARIRPADIVEVRAP